MRNLFRCVFKQSNPIPYNEMNFATNGPISFNTNTNIAQAGTLTIEFGTPSKHTGNDTYRQLAEKSTQAVMISSLQS